MIKWRRECEPFGEASAVHQPCQQAQLLLGCHFGKPGPCSSTCSCGPLAGPVNTAPLPTMCHRVPSQPVPNYSFAQVCLLTSSASLFPLLGPLISGFWCLLLYLIGLLDFFLKLHSSPASPTPQHPPGRTALSVLRGGPKLAFFSSLMLTLCLISIFKFFLLYVNCNLDLQLGGDATYLLWS